ncbi:MAG: hypothetical protein K8R67_10880 [Desulfobacteraceae bacterium]|nr:hypothetical protein [Desulfobacteraceae bacterium]
MFDIIKNYLKKAKEEALKEYVISSAEKGWIGVDLDGTLAWHDANTPMISIGEPVPLMLKRVKHMVKQGYRVKIFTARAQDSEQILMIRKWLKKNGLPALEITNIKDYNMIKLFDDRAVQVERNTGKLILPEK